MKFRSELLINKPRANVWNAFDNPQNMKKWQRSLITFETVSGTQGQPGAVSILTFEEHGRQFELTERVTYREEPNRLDGVYENDFADNIVKNTFVEQGKEQTLWVVETEFKFKTLVMRILGPWMKKNFVARTQKDMERFKEMVESR
jgi:uncharacterized protein YndB with AHSA1/START domain